MPTPNDEVELWTATGTFINGWNGSSAREDGFAALMAVPSPPVDHHLYVRISTGVYWMVVGPRPQNPPNR